MSVTIGDQKFVKDSNKGWMDAKTKQPADTGLIKLLDSLMVEEPEAKKLRVKIDRNVEPVSINGQKFVYDVNQGWIDEKTKVRAAESLQRTLNMAGLGISGTAGLQKVKEAKAPTKKSGGGTLVNNRNTAINKPLLAMINQLASIDGYLKQQLQTKQIITAKAIAQDKETAIEAKDIGFIQDGLVPDAKPESSNIAALGTAAALAALVAYQFEPVKDALKQISDFGIGVGNFVANIAKTLNSGFEWLLGNKTKNDINDLAPNTAPTAPGQQASPVATATASVPAGDTSSTMAYTNLQAPSVLSADPKVREQAFAQKSTPSAPSLLPRSPAATSVSTLPTKPSAPVNAFFTSKPSMLSNDPAQRAQAIVEKDKTEVQTYGLKAKGGRTSGKAPAIPRNNIVALGNYLISQGADRSKMQHSAFGAVGEHSKNSRHYRDMAIDVNFPGPNEGAILDALQPQLRAAGYNTIWRAAGHETHMHVSVGGPEGIGGFGGGESPMASAVDTITGVMESAKNIFGKAGAALIGTKDYTKRELTTPASKLGPLAKSYEMAKTDAMVDSRTPKPVPTVSKTVSPPNINPNKSSPVIQTPATESDMGGVNYYLERFGFMPAQSEMARI
jgi:hypothetical protein